MKNILFTLFFSAFSLLTYSQKFDDNFFNNFEKAYQKDPVQYLKNEVASDFTFIYGDGRLVDRESVLKIYEIFNPVSRTTTELKTRQLGNTGIATGILNHAYTTKQDGSPRDWTSRFTYTFTLQKGKWQLAAVHLTDMPPMPFTEKTLQDMSTRILADFRKYMQEEASSDIRITLAEGQVTDHKSMIGLLPALQITKWSLSDIKISHFGNMAVATGINIHDVLNVKANTTTHFTVRFTYTYAYINGKWMWMQWQHTHIQTSFTEQTLLDMNKRIVQDFTKFVSEEVSPEYSFTTADGAVVNYQFMKDAKLKVVEWNTHDLKIKQIGNVAIVRGINDHLIQSTTSNDISKYSVHFIYTFEYKKDKWLWLTAHHIYNNPSKAEQEAAIKTATEAETKAYHDGNTEGVRAAWLFTPQTRAAATTTAGQTLFANSGDQLRQFYTDLKPDNNTFSNTNYNIKINTGGNSASVTYDQTTMDKEGKTLYLSHEFRNMQKVNGVWKIAGLSSHQYKP